MPPTDDRRRLALMLVCLLAGTTAATFGLLFGQRWFGVRVEDVKDVLTMIYPPLIALVTSVTHAYFRNR